MLRTKLVHITFSMTAIDSPFTYMNYIQPVNYFKSPLTSTTNITLVSSLISPCTTENSDSPSSTCILPRVSTLHKCFLCNLSLIFTLFHWQFWVKAKSPIMTKKVPHTPLLQLYWPLYGHQACQTPSSLRDFAHAAPCLEWSSHAPEWHVHFLEISAQIQPPQWSTLATPTDHTSPSYLHSLTHNFFFSIALIIL